MSDRSISVQERLEKRIHWLFEKIEELQQEADQLQEENEQLEVKNQRLLEENKALREEVTLNRLREGVTPLGVWEAYARQEASISEEAHAFYRELPPSFNFSTYFSLADEHELSSTTARSYLISFLREGLLHQEGHWIEKTRSFSPLSRRPWPMQREPSGCV